MANSSPVTRDELKTTLSEVLKPIADGVSDNRNNLKVVSDTVIRIETQQKHYEKTVDTIETRLTTGTRHFSEQDTKLGVLDSKVEQHEKRLDRQDKRSMGVGGASGGVSGGVVSGAIEFFKGLFGG